MNPLVSVVIPFFDAERFFDETIRSVIAQTYPYWELLLIDDGSQDGSRKIAERYIAKYAGRIFLLHHPDHENRGMSASRNLGISRASGEYIALLDADDVWVPEKLEQQVQILQANPEASLVYGRWMHWNSWDGNHDPVRGDSESQIDIATDTVIEPPGLFEHFYKLRKGGHTPPPANILFRRDAALRIGQFEDRFRGMYEDQAFLVKMFLKEKVIVSDKLWCKIRHHPDSFVRRQLQKQDEVLASWLAFLSWFESYLIQEGFRGNVAWHWTQKALWRHRHPVLFRLRNFASVLRSGRSGKAAS